VEGKEESKPKVKKDKSKGEAKPKEKVKKVKMDQSTR